MGSTMLESRALKVCGPFDRSGDDAKARVFEESLSKTGGAPWHLDGQELKQSKEALVDDRGRAKADHLLRLGPGYLGMLSVYPAVTWSCHGL